MFFPSTVVPCLNYLFSKVILWYSFVSLCNPIHFVQRSVKKIRNTSLFFSLVIPKELLTKKYWSMPNIQKCQGMYLWCVIRKYHVTLQVLVMLIELMDRNFSNFVQYCL